MTETKILPPVVHHVDVSVDVATAFAAYTGRMSEWWPKEHHIGSEDIASVVLEPRTGGRVYEVGVDGAECDWGQVLVWAPPNQVVIAWQINAQWQYDPDLAHASEYEVRFEPIDDGTRVTVEHRHFERHGEGGTSIRAALDDPSGWPGTLAAFAALVSD